MSTLYMPPFLFALEITILASVVSLTGSDSLLPIISLASTALFTGANEYSVLSIV